MILRLSKNKIIYTVQMTLSYIALQGYPIIIKLTNQYITKFTTSKLNGYEY